MSRPKRIAKPTGGHVVLVPVADDVHDAPAVRKKTKQSVLLLFVEVAPPGTLCEFMFRYLLWEFLYFNTGF